MTRGREQRTAPILSHGQTTSGQCGFNQAASHPADPIKRHRARRERSHPKAMLTTQTSAVALDLLENGIGAKPQSVWTDVKSRLAGQMRLVIEAETRRSLVGGMAVAVLRLEPRRWNSPWCNRD